MVTIEILNTFGANTAEGLERCLQDEEFYLDLIPDAMEKMPYDRLDKAIKEGNMIEAYKAARALRGVLANLALTPITEPLNEMTKLLREKSDADYAALMQKIWDERKRLMDMAEL